MRNLWRASQDSLKNTHTILFVTGAASEDTLSVGTERACQALDGCCSLRSSILLSSALLSGQIGNSVIGKNFRALTQA